MSFVILVTGNIASGKSTLCEKLAKRLGLPLYGIDQERRHANKEFPRMTDHFNDRRHFQNYRNAVARNKFHDKLSSFYEGIFEASGFSKGFSHNLSRNVAPLLHLHLTCPKNILLKRIKAKIKEGYRWPETPDWWSEGTESVFESLEISVQYMNNQPLPKAQDSLEEYRFHTLDAHKLDAKKLYDTAIRLINEFDKSLDDPHVEDVYEDMMRDSNYYDEDFY